MKEISGHPGAMIRIKPYAVAFPVLWSLIVGILMWQENYDVRRGMISLALTEARGLYNSHLEFLSPEYMTRQNHILQRDKENGAHEHLIGLVPDRPRNAPDSWELAGLRLLQQGNKEVNLFDYGNPPRLRYLGPVVMRGECQACHRSKDYRIGSIYGGVSVTVPLQPFMDEAQQHSRSLIPKFAFLWCLGLLGIGIAIRNLGKRVAQEKQAQDALRVSEERLSNVVDAAQDGIVILDPDGNISMWNRSAERIFGYSAQEAIGRNLRTFLAPNPCYEDQIKDFDKIRRSGEGEETGAALEMSAVRKNGQEFSVELALSSVRLEDGWHAVGIVRDITERKLAEETLQETNRHLEEATMRANNMAVMAEMANTAKSEFVANMSHEIRTPMNGIIGMTGLLMDTDLNEEQRRYVETVQNSSEALLSLINDILDFSKIEAGRLEIESIDFDLRGMLDDFAALMSIKAAEKGLEFICGANPEVPTGLRGDPGRLRQILTNLAGNALKFTEKGEVAVRVSLESDIEADVLLRFSVRDTGIGIPRDKIHMLFKKFSQVDASTTRKYGGTGLGLAISKRLTELMGGEIHVSSEEGEGSEFWFTARFRRQQDYRRNEVPLPADIRGARVLVVDDNATNREVVLSWIKSWQLRAAEAIDARSALEMMLLAHEAGDPFQIAILDMVMPEMDGEELGKAICSDARLAGTILIMMTSLGRRGDARKFAELGFSAYLTKPVRQSELFDCLAAAMAGEKRVQEPRPIITRHTLREMHRSSVRILLAEDNLTNQQVALGILNKLGLRADAVANGKEALARLQTSPYDLVLMDVQMPVMDGLEATRAIRNPRSAVLDHHIPIIAMTAHAAAADRDLCLSSGMNDYVSKPVKPQVLAATLEKWLPQESGPKEVPAAAITKQAPPPAGRIPDASIFDRSALIERLMDDDELKRIVIEGFLDDMPRQIEVLKGCVAAGDVEGAKRQAHSIKGAAANVGGKAFSDVASGLEKAGSTGALEILNQGVPELVRQFSLLKEAMQA
jgi:PAS domain S-box-containing protein